MVRHRMVSATIWGVTCPLTIELYLRVTHKVNGGIEQSLAIFDGLRGLLNYIPILHREIDLVIGGYTF
jgi:hypothetical protein